MEYADFLKTKLKNQNEKGIIIDEADLNSALFDYQRAIVKKALEKKKFCLFESCGMGKTIQQLEWAYQVEKHINKPVLILAPLGVTVQTVEEEADLLKRYIPDSVEVRGSDNPKRKEQCAIGFKRGDIRVLISKPKIFGYGMNFQKCNNVIFCGLTYSYENYYQALRRIYRFGQKNKVYSYIVLGSTELSILENINKKKENQTALKNQMDLSVKEIQLLDFKGKEVKKVKGFQKIQMPEFI